MRRIRLVALDLDGTLLDDSKQVPTGNLEALKEAEQQGILICLASGRMISTIETIESQLGVDSIIIGYNGGKVVGRRSEGRPLIVHRPLAADVAEIFLRFAEEHGYLLNFYYRDLLYAEDSPERRPLIELYTRRTGAEYHLVEDLRKSFSGVPPTKLILLAYPAERDRLCDMFRAKLAHRAAVSRSEPEYLEITAPDADKGSALDLVAGRYGIARDEIMAVGDAENDTGMMRVAGISVAMANSASYVKAAARFVTERSNNHAGAGEAIRRWALAE